MEKVERKFSSRNYYNWCQIINIITIVTDILLMSFVVLLLFRLEWFFKDLDQEELKKFKDSPIMMVSVVILIIATIFSVAMIVAIIFGLKSMWLADQSQKLHNSSILLWALLSLFFGSFIVAILLFVMLSREYQKSDQAEN
ncbi:Uncharacterised protein [Mycoplasmopsis californica]|uniref:Uncharacterized protein n=1 Tax=Mycoplasmopsis equigenitalium TaxID=114883 RepID=A0ABY5J5A9_9BACT|nr:hypothetical protein [Mycoplasmopsis equigenitalium]UUD37150.1 hypothetical protein NPA09_01070 [Mycoplasmopsis equigenitalium]VEU69544.1 Uncharacterised protein [Mycoplasmopsis californica]